MKYASRIVISCASLVAITSALASPGPGTGAVIAGIAGIDAPKDRAYPGEILLTVNAADLGHRVIHVHERITGFRSGGVLLYPKWLPGTHAPEGPIDKVSGVTITANSKPISWTRDPLDVYALHPHAAAGTATLDIDFDYLSPTGGAVGAVEMSQDLLMIEWNALVLYPAGFFVRQIPVEVTLTLPASWQWASALESESVAGNRAVFKRVDLETLIDSPLYAGRYTARLDLDPGSKVPVHLNLFADRPGLLSVEPKQLEAHRALVRQAYKLFGSHHFAHYDFLYSLSDQIQQTGLEHHQSSENGSDPDLFTSWDKTAYQRDLLPHEFTHSWNGKFRRPADLWTPSYHVPMQNSLLWVYEGQTQYWGQVLAARSGLRSQQQALDQLAQTAAYYENEAGRQWRTLQDTTNDEIINPRRPQSWIDWQRFEEYYGEGALIWLDADTLIRERSQGKRSLDDFAKAFFGTHDGSFVTVTYTFTDVVNALNAVEPYDWSSFLRQRLDSVGQAPPLDGLRRGGYQLVYSDTPSDYARARDEQGKRVNLLYSIGIQINDKDTAGTIAIVLWNSAAFKVPLTEGDQIMAVDGVAYNADVLKEAIRAARSAAKPIELIIKNGERFRVISLDYHGGLRYAHLERDSASPPRLDDILAARP